MFRYVAPILYVKRIYKTKNHKCELSGYEWTEKIGEPIRYEVSGPYGATDVKRFKANKRGAIKAVRYAREMNAFFQKFPMEITTDQKQVNKSIALGLDLTGLSSRL